MTTGDQITLIQALRFSGRRFTKPNIYDDSADRIVALEAALQICRGALADLGMNKDMGRADMQRKAMRIYNETAKAAGD